MKTKQAGLGLLIFGILLIALGIYLVFDPTVADWVALNTFSVRVGFVLPLKDIILLGIWKAFANYGPLCGIISLVLGIGFILL